MSIDCYHTKVKELYELFLKSKGEKIRKVSKAVKSPNNGDIKSVSIRLPKTASNLSNHTAQSNIITQELEDIENPNIFDLESFTTEHPKTNTNLSKPINQPKIITQQPNKINVYTESKADDRMI